MKKVLLSTIIALMLMPTVLTAGKSNKHLDEKGITLIGNCKAIASSPDGYTYVLMDDKRLIKIDVDGKQTTIVIPFTETINSSNDYFCDMCCDAKQVHFCGYSYSSILSLDLKNPKQLTDLEVRYNGKNINPLMICRNSHGWTLQDSEFRTFKVDNKGGLTHLPANSFVRLDANNNPIVQSQPLHLGDRIIFPASVMTEFGREKWKAPLELKENQVASVEYLGYASDRDCDVYMVNVGNGDMDTAVSVYAVNSAGKVIAKRSIPKSNVSTAMRFCKLASDGSIIAVYADPEAPEERVVIKKFFFKGKTHEQG